MYANDFVQEVILSLGRHSFYLVFGNLVSPNIERCGLD